MKYSSYSFLTLALDGVSGQHHTPNVLYPPGKDLQYPLHRRLGGPQRLEEKLFIPARDQTPVIQSVVRHYTDSATPWFCKTSQKKSEKDLKYKLEFKVSCVIFSNLKFTSIQNFFMLKQGNFNHLLNST
jgi:hypothetical protein